MKYLTQDSEPGMDQHWQMLIEMIEEHYVTEENDNDYLVLGLYTISNVDEIKQKYLKGVNYRKLIVYQLEPLVERHWISKERIEDFLHGYDEIWDYDLENIEYLQKLGYDPKFRPMRYTKNLKKFKTVDDPKIDVLFFGSPTDDRFYHINHIMWNRNLDYNIAWMNGIQGKKLDYFMAESKIILNLKTYKQSRQAQTRIFYALNNEKCVLSQHSDINYFGNNIIEFFDEHQMMEHLTFLISNNCHKKESNLKNSIFYNKSKIAVFVYVRQNKNWSDHLCYIISELQNSGLFDFSEYINICFDNSNIFNYRFEKINRVKYQISYNNFLKDVSNFSYLNPGYKVLHLDIENDPQHIIRVKQNVRAINEWQTATEILKNKIMVSYSKYAFWFKNDNMMFLNDVNNFDQYINQRRYETLQIYN